MNRLVLIGAANELAVVNNLLKLPFGAYEHLKGLQVFGLPEAQACVEAFNELAGRRNFKGLPIYIGHPDVKAFQDKYRDHAAYGWITALAANEEEGRLEMTVQWTAPGEQLIANEQFAYFSPLWLSVKKAGNLHPFSIKSVGLTQEPNIQFLAVACEELQDEPANQGGTMNMLDRLRALIGNDSVVTEDDAVGFVEKMLHAVRAIRAARQANYKAEDAAYQVLANEDVVAALDGFIAHLEDQAEALANEVPETAQATIAQLQSEIETANEGLKTLRGSHSKLLLDQALADGRITPATRAKWEARFGADDADFEAVANELGSIDTAMKTRRATQGAKPGDGADLTHGDVIAAANELMTARKCDFEAAYQIAKKDPRFKPVFDKA